MYRIGLDEIKKKALTSDYLTKYKDDLRKLINAFIAGDPGCIFGRKVGTKSPMSFTIKVDPSSFTNTFLQRCVDPKDSLLDDLLIGEIDKQIDIIQMVLKDSSHHFEKLGVKKAAALKYSSGTIDDFHAIMNEIFINRGFDGEKTNKYAVPFDKTQFVKDLKIRICPYCGRSYVYHAEKQGSKKVITVKPQIDHFLPKTKYPFWGMNFFNLIPSCTQCNMSPCKGANDPLNPRKRRIKYLMHPYEFDDNSIRLIGRLNSSHILKTDSYDVLVGYSNKDYLKGYNKFLTLDKFYEGHRVEFQNMYLQEHALHVITKGLYRRFGIRSTPLMMDYALLGFRFGSVEEGRQLMYKFKKDLYVQILPKLAKTKATPYFVEEKGMRRIVNV